MIDALTEGHRDRRTAATRVPPPPPPSMANLTRQRRPTETLFGRLALPD
jgi:hypothetical protein